MQQGELGVEQALTYALSVERTWAWHSPETLKVAMLLRGSIQQLL